MSRPMQAVASVVSLATVVVLSGCVSSPGPEQTGSGRCQAGELQWAVGQPAEEANLKRLFRESGAGLINPIGPATVVSKDRRDDRLRVFIDKDNVITAVRCE
jgi:hypothetical protein